MYYTQWCSLYRTIVHGAIDIVVNKSTDHNITLVL